MKKLWMSIIAALAATVTMNLTAIAKTVISDCELAEVTAEEGVSIGFDLTVASTTTAATISWGDGDGYSSGGHGGAGYAGMTNTSVTGNLAKVSNTAVIDVGSNGTETRVNVVLPTIQLGAMNVAATMKVSNQQNLSGGKIMGTLNVSGFQTQITGSGQVFAH